MLPKAVWLWQVVNADTPEKRRKVVTAQTDDGWLKAGYRLADETIVTVELRQAAGPVCGEVDDVGGLHAVCCLPAAHLDCPHVGVADLAGLPWQIRSVTVQRPLGTAMARASAGA